ncbi:hypothetical protein BH23ACI1_BH23ACI1_00070 [soil metagenome]
MNFNDPQVQSAVTDIPFDDLQEVQVSTSGQSAEFGSASGGVFNFITKSGGNQLRGLASAYGQNKGLASNNFSADLAAQGIGPSVLDKNYEAGGNIGGPIMRDRLWFFGSYHRQEQERSQSDFPEPIGVSQWQSTIKLDGQISPGNRVGVFYPTSGMVYTAGKYQLEALVADLRRQLGERFDLRAFHDRFMAAGPVPIAAHRLGVDRGRQGIAEGTRRARRSRSAAQPSSAGR